MPRAVVVVPCYNEAARLDTGAFREFDQGGQPVRFLFVNDGSTDATQDVLDELRRINPACFDVLELPANVGKAEAVRRGVLHAVAARPDYVGFWDADLATPLETITTFTTALDCRPDLEMVIGARVCLLGRSVKRQALRHMLGRAFATAASLVLGLSVYDTQCGAKLFRTTDEMVELFRQPFVSRWIFDVELLARLVSARRQTSHGPIDAGILEYPLPEWHDVSGSKLRARDFVRAVFELMAIRRRYLSGGVVENCAANRGADRRPHGAIPRPCVVEDRTPRFSRPLAPGSAADAI